jgi:hypothetical protein
MRLAYPLPRVATIVTATVYLVGCGSDSSETPAQKITGAPPPLAGEMGDEQDAHAGHQHPTEGPHGGHLIELGNEEYHAELLHDESTHKVTIHLLDGAGKELVAIAEPEITMQLFLDGRYVKFALKAIPSQERPQGAASKFEVVDASLCDALCHGDQIRGRLQVTINGTPYTGTIEHSSHADDDHEGHNH